MKSKNFMVLATIPLVLLGVSCNQLQSQSPLATPSQENNVASKPQAPSVDPRMLEDSPPEEPAKEDVAIVNIDSWQIQLLNSQWNGSTLNVNLKITNLGARRNFGFSSLSTPGQPHLAVIDSTGKKIDPWVRQPDFSQGEFIVLPPYAKEYYPNESWSGTLRFDMSLYSGKTTLCIGRYSWTETLTLFDLGSP